MRLRVDHLFPLAVLGMLALMTFWLERAARIEEPRPPDKQRHDPDVIVDKLAARSFAADGTLRYSLSAARMKHYPDDDATEISQALLSFHAREPVTHVSAAHAHLTEHQEIVRMSGGVLVRREAAPNRPEVRLTTERLTVHTEEERAVTDAQVRVVQGGSEISGTGLEMDNRSSTMVLKSEVRARMEPKGRAAR